MSFFLALVDVVDEVVAAEATFSLLDQDHKPVPSGSRTTSTVDFSKFRLLGYGFKYFIRSQELERSEFLNDDCFTVRVDLHIVKQVPVPPMAVVPPSDMHRHLGGLLSSKLGADVEFLVGWETFAAHWLVLRARSPVFKAELSVPTMKEGVATNAAIIEIEGMEAPVFRAMLAFIYTDTWPDMDGQDESAMAPRLLAKETDTTLRRHA
jgi:speckle-type POZ protein